MADAVRGNAVILYAKLGTNYYPIACSKDVSITTTSDFLELAPRSSSVWREFIPGRMTGQITGNGITKIDGGSSTYSVFDLISYQHTQLPVLAKFELTDPSSNVKVFECRTYVEECNISGEAARLSNHSYSLKITGPVTITTTPVETGAPEVGVYEYTATGGETTLTLTVSAYATVIALFIDGLSVKVVDYPAAYLAGEASYDSATGTIYLGTAALVGQYYKVIYVDLTAATDYLQDGAGNVLEDGAGNLLVEP